MQALEKGLEIPGPAKAPGVTGAGGASTPL